jgi:hypothetical protein
MAIIVATLTMSGQAAFAEGSSRATSPMRSIHFRSVSPPFGVEVRLDDTKIGAIVVGERLAVDARMHHLTLACVRDMCEPSQISIAPDSNDAELDVALNVRPAQIQIEGNLAHRFAIAEEPSLGCACAGVPMAVPLHTGERVVHVVDQQTSRSITVVLVAGRTTLVSFF